MKGEGLVKAGPNMRGEDGGCMYGRLCVLSRAKGPQERRGVLWNYSYSFNAEREALDSFAPKTHPLKQSDLQ